MQNGLLKKHQTAKWLLTIKDHIMEFKQFLLSSKENKHKTFFFFSPLYAFAIVMIVFQILFSIFIYYFSHKSYYSRIQSQLVTDSNRIENVLQDAFTETYQVMLYVGKQISLYAEQDPQFIEKILVNSPEFVSNIKNFYPWSLFDWVDPKGYRIINSQIGRIPNGPMKVNDSYIFTCPKHPWTLQVSHPTIGNTSGMWVIPTGLGVLNEKNEEYLGTLNVGINIAELNVKAQQVLPSKEISFIVLDDDFRIILQSANNALDPKSSYYRDILPSKSYFKEQQSHLSTPITYKDIKYTYYKKTKDFPYIILTGFDTKILQQDFLALLLPRLLELYGVGIFCLCLLYFLRKRLFTIGKNSENAKKTFLERLSSELKESVEKILAYSNTLIRHSGGQTSVVVTNERRNEFIERIYEEALKLSALTGTSVNYTYLPIQTLVKDSLEILIKKAIKMNFNIKTLLKPTLMPFYGDEFRLKQVIASLISLSMEYSPPNSTIKISATNQISNTGKDLLIITIEDNGFNLDAEDMMRLAEKFSYEKQDDLGIQLDFVTIENLIRPYNGTCYICNTLKGKIIKLSLSYDHGQVDSSEPSKDNVHWLFGKSTHLP